MASPNVDKALLALQNDSALAAQLQSSFAKIEAAAKVELTTDEKKEFLRELAALASRESLSFRWD